jgi:hypothetical protein
VSGGCCGDWKMSRVQMKGLFQVLTPALEFKQPVALPGLRSLSKGEESVLTKLPKIHGVEANLCIMALEQVDQTRVAQINPG